MRFLRHLLFSGGVIATMAAASSQCFATVPPGNATESSDLSAEKKSDELKTDEHLSIVGSLNHSLEITNPYNTAQNDPFKIVESTMTAAEAEKVYCGGQYWTDGQSLGYNNDGPLTVAIIQHRIYVKIGGNVTNNRYHVLHAVNSPYPLSNPNSDPLLKRCVNDQDPSTFTNGYLGPLENGVIKCNNKPITDNLLLGTFRGGDNVNTLQIARIDNGFLRIAAWRQDGREYNPFGYNSGLMEAIINRENNSFLNPSLGYTLSMDEIKSCFWDNLPNYPEVDPNTPAPNCASGPTLTGISNVSKTGLTFDFSGTGISTIKWRILKNGTPLGNVNTTGDLSGTTSVNISFSSVEAGNYTLEIQGNNCVSTASLLAFTVTEPVIVIPACQNGPGIAAIRDISATGVTVDFTGSNLHIFSWRILTGTYPVASGKTGYLNSTSAPLTFNFLPNGTYTFELTADDCIATNTVVQNFTVSGPDNRPACPRGPTLDAILGSSPAGLSFRFDGEEIYTIDWKVMQGSTMLRQNRVSPGSNSPAIQFETLPSGSYSFQIEGGNCKSTPSATSFTVGVLPIYISEFKGSVVEAGVELSWNVVSEKNGEGFEILRYEENMKNAEVIGKVSLTDVGIGKYKFVDESPLLGINYYQLKQLDADGTFVKSKIISVNPGLISGTIVAPNPASDYVNILFSSRNAGLSNVEIYNVSGIKVSTSQIKITEGKNSHRINVGKLNEGNYFMKVSTSTGEAAKLKFVKAN
ncbi:T9SS type A sorting domain-containing protein [Dyadobacter psychrotolerans]|uniref:T9SS type A sorting domain-containing protein n=1 Tax=Dyadobacter psychrotolerans TaxID=2541721 RepID=A0A4R5DM68_9BACT|nr:T9SS type A sorting domain-containing protein [Dyadobacter psychrotolerans]TDE15362.1 T9SS type A sorting domain-containing protein [Dyadobacter psychrotolerans]